VKLAWRNEIMAMKAAISTKIIGMKINVDESTAGDAIGSASNAGNGTACVAA